MLEDYQGALQTDGYKAYDQFKNNESITLLACWAHARRYFDKASKNHEEQASYALRLIQKLYKIERKCQEQELSLEKIKEIREEEAKPLLDEFYIWLLEKASQNDFLPQSAIGRAITYTLKLWPRLTTYLQDGRYIMDNNLIENKIRALVLGRKNYMFAGSEQAAKHAAMLYSFFATCKGNDINPYEWLKHTLENINDTKLSELHSLLPVKGWSKK